MANIPDDEPTKVIRDDAWVKGESVTILTYRGNGVAKRINDALVAFSPGEDGKPSIQYQTGRAASVKLHSAIVDWMIFTASGKAFPFSDANIDKLPDEYADFILEEINKSWDSWKTATGQDAQGKTGKEVAQARKPFSHGPTSAAGGHQPTDSAEEEGAVS